MILPVFPISDSSRHTTTLRAARHRVKPPRFALRGLQALVLAFALFPTTARAQERVDSELLTPAGAAPRERVTAADLTASCYPLTRPKTRRRAVGKGGPPCTSNPTVRLTVDAFSTDDPFDPRALAHYLAPFRDPSRIPNTRP